MFRFFLLLRTVRHLTLEQTVFRIKYILKRKTSSLLYLIVPFIFSTFPRSYHFRIAKNLPKSIFKPKSSSLQINNNIWVFNFMNDEHKFKKEDLWSEYDVKNRLWMMTLHYFEWINILDDDDLVFCFKSWIKSNRPFSYKSWQIMNNIF